MDRRGQTSEQGLHGLADLIEGLGIVGIILADAVDAYCQFIDFLGHVALLLGGHGDLQGALGNVVEAGDGARQRSGFAYRMPSARFTGLHGLYRLARDLLQGLRLVRQGVAPD
ncbi:MAG: hypothetical protein V4812_05205 [Pseudomonadota bacterium]